MGFLALILSLLLEQARALARGNPVDRAIGAFADAVVSATDAGESRHGAVGWVLVVAGVAALVAGLEWLAGTVHPLAVFIVHVAVLYLTMGFRQFSHPFTEVQLALVAGDVAGAREALRRWLREDAAAADPDVSEICRASIARALVASHRHVLAPLFWYVLIPGAVGPVVYRVAQGVAARWRSADGSYGRFARDAYAWLDWLPTRLSAAGFAIVGSFEDAVFAWRSAVAAGVANDQRAMLLAAGGGALGLRLLDPDIEARWAQNGHPTAELSGAEPGVDAMHSAAAMVWRSVILWIGLYGMLSVASWLGR